VGWGENIWERKMGEHEIDVLKKRIEELEKLDAERKKAENMLSLHSEIMKNMSEGIYLIGADDGIIKYCNPKFENIFGYSPGEMIGKHVSMVNAPTDKDPKETVKDIMGILDKTGEWHGEVNNIKKDGTTFWCYANCSIFQHPMYGRVIAAVHRDITERKKSQEQIKHAADEWQNTFDSISDIIFILDNNHTIRKVNKVFLDAFKLKPEEVIGRKCYELVHKSNKPWQLCPHAKTMQDKKAHTEEVDDPVLGIPLLVSTSPIFNANGECVGSVHIAKNISEVKKARQELELKIRDLERFQKVTVGREKRIIELKEEMKKLKAELEKK